MSMMKEDAITLCIRMSYRMEGEEQVQMAGDERECKRVSEDTIIFIFAKFVHLLFRG
jgi:hypothetical protein